MVPAGGVGLSALAPDLFVGGPFWDKDENNAIALPVQLLTGNPEKKGGAGAWGSEPSSSPCGSLPAFSLARPAVKTVPLLPAAPPLPPPADPPGRAQGCLMGWSCL